MLLLNETRRSTVTLTKDGILMLPPCPRVEILAPSGMPACSMQPISRVALGSSRAHAHCLAVNNTTPTSTSIRRADLLIIISPFINGGENDRLVFAIGFGVEQSQRCLSAVPPPLYTLVPTSV